jgi:hypothetical protein
MLRKEFYALDEHQRLVFMHGKIDRQGTDDGTPNLHVKGRETVEWLAKRGGGLRQALDELPKSGQDRFAAAFLGSLTLNVL